MNHVFTKSLVQILFRGNFKFFNRWKWFIRLCIKICHLWKSRATYRLRWLTYWPKNPKKHISTFQTFLRKIVKFSNFEKSFLVMWFLIKNKPYAKIFSSLYITCVTCRYGKSQPRAYFSAESHENFTFYRSKVWN